MRSGATAPSLVAASRPRAEAGAPFDLQSVRNDFPILRQQVRGRPLVYLDNAATAQRPQTVIDAVSRFYGCENANIHRGVHHLSEQATAAYDQVRERTVRFLNARTSREVVFTRGTTDSINLVAQSYARANLRAGDEVLITTMEHHSNIVPWQQACARTGAVLRVAPIDDRGDLIMDELEQLVTDRTKMVAVVQISNALGTVNPIEQIIALARRVGATTLIDGSQAAHHVPTDVQALGADFYVFTGHKTYGPTGIGVLWGRETVLEAMPPFLGGGDMIRTVTFEGC